MKWSVLLLAASLFGAGSAFAEPREAPARADGEMSRPHMGHRPGQHMSEEERRAMHRLLRDRAAGQQATPTAPAELRQSLSRDERMRLRRELEEARRSRRVPDPDHPRTRQF